MTTENDLSSRGGLTGWGVLLIVIGAATLLYVLGGAMQWADAIRSELLAPPAKSARASSGRPPAIGFMAIVGLIAMLAAGGGILWTGIGSCLGRRWVRPVVMIAAVVVIVVGLMQIVAQLLVLPTMLKQTDVAMFERRDPRTPQSGSVLTAAMISIGIRLVLGVVLPWLVFRFYRSERTRAALDAIDPRVLWSDRLPVAVLGWTAFAAFAGVGLLATLYRPSIPAFVVLLAGREAIIAIAIAGTLLVWSAWICWRREWAGWLISLIVIVAMRASYLTYFLTGGTPAEVNASLTASAFDQPTRGAAAKQRKDLVPEWVAPVLEGLDLLVVLGFGIYAGTQFGSGGRPAGEAAEESQPIA